MHALDGEWFGANEWVKHYRLTMGRAKELVESLDIP